MIYGIGTDLCKVERMGRSLQSKAFWQRVFGPQEREALFALGEKRRMESAAACFAAKEAFLKAAGRGLGGFDLGDIQALRRESGAPYYRLSGSAAEWMEQNGLRAWLSLTHEDGLAQAMTVLEKSGVGD